MTEQTQAAHQEAMIAQSVLDEPPSAITLLVISQREHLFGKLLAQFSETAAICLFKNCVNNPEQIPCTLEQAHPGLLLVDAALAAPAVSEWLHTIRKQDAAVKIILLYDEVLPDLLNEIVEFGISGLLKIDASPEVYRKAIQTVHNGELWLPHLLISRIITTCSTQILPLSRKAHIDLPAIISTSALTQRELRVIELVAQGLTNKQIAKQLNISPETVKKKLTNIFDKSGVRSRSQLVSIYAASLQDRFPQNLV